MPESQAETNVLPHVTNADSETVPTADTQVHMTHTRRKKAATIVSRIIHPEQHRMRNDAPFTNKDIRRYETTNDAFKEALPKRIIECLSDPDPAIRAQAVASLSVLPVEERGAYLEEAFYDPETPVHEAAARSIKFMPDTQMSTFMSKAYADLEPAVKRAAAKNLKYLPEEDRNSWVQTSFVDTDDDVRLAAIRCVSLLPEDQRSLYIQNGLQDSSFPVRYTAARI